MKQRNVKRFYEPFARGVIGSYDREDVQADVNALDAPEHFGDATFLVLGDETPPIADATYRQIIMRKDWYGTDSQGLFSTSVAHEHLIWSNDDHWNLSSSCWRAVFVLRQMILQGGPSDLYWFALYIDPADVICWPLFESSYNLRDGRF